MDVHFRSAFHPLLGRLRIGAPRLWPLSPELHTSDCSSACPGSSTWVDKVPSQDTPSLDLANRRGGVDPGDPQVAHTPSLNLAGCQGGVHPDGPQVARNQSRYGGALTPALTRIERSPEQPSVNAVSSVSVVWPTSARPRRISASIAVSVLVTAAKPGGLRQMFRHCRGGLRDAVGRPHSSGRRLNPGSG